MPAATSTRAPRAGTGGSVASVSAQTLLDRVASLYREPDWLSRRRVEALSVYQGMPLPDRATHLWRYTDPMLFETTDGSGVPSPPRPDAVREFPAVLVESLSSEALAAAAYVRDGLVWKTAIDDKLAARGVIVMDLHTAASGRPDLVQGYLGSLIGSEFGRVEALVEATWTEGLLVYVPRGVQIDRPVHIVTASPPRGSHRAGRLLIVVEDQASLEIIDEYGESAESQDDVTVHVSTVVEMIVGAGSRVKYVPVQNWSRAAVSHLSQRARLGDDAYFETILAAVGSQVSKVDCGAILAGKGAESNIFGLGIGDGRQHFDHHTVQHHAAGHTKSDLHFKVALRDRAESIYTGLIRIEERADYCEAYQENRNLMLSSSARADSIPELEILNNEVRCTHGATVGKVDPQEIFYLESRGIDSAAAVRLIVAGFVDPILDRVPRAARDRLRRVILSRLHGN